MILWTVFGVALAVVVGAVAGLVRLMFDERRRVRQSRELTPVEPRPDYRLLPFEKHPCPRCGADMYGNPAVVGVCAACHEVAFERKVREDKAQFRALGFGDQDEADRELKASIERKMLAVPPSNERRVILFDDDDEKEAG